MRGGALRVFSTVSSWTADPLPRVQLPVKSRSFGSVGGAVTGSQVRASVGSPRFKLVPKAFLETGWDQSELVWRLQGGVGWAGISVTSECLLAPPGEPSTHRDHQPAAPQIPRTFLRVLGLEKTLLAQRPRRRKGKEIHLRMWL